jgi:hypothetical protein
MATQTRDELGGLVEATRDAYREYKGGDTSHWGGRASQAPRLREAAARLACHLRQHPGDLPRVRAALSCREFAEILADVHEDVEARDRHEICGEYRLPDGTAFVRAGHSDLAYADLIVAILSCRPRGGEEG